MQNTENLLKEEVTALRARVDELERRLALAAAGRPAHGADENGDDHRQSLIAEERERLLETIGDEISRAEIDALRAQERAGVLEAVINAMVDPVLIFDARGDPIYANSAAAVALGLDPMQLVWKESVMRFNARRDDERQAALADLPVARALRSEKISGEPWRFTDARGQDHVILVSAGPVAYNNNETGVVLTWHDITERGRLMAERERAETAMRQSEQRFRELADSMPQLVWTANPDGTVDYYNNRYAEYHGISQAAEQNGWSWSPVVHPDDLKATEEIWNRAVRTGQTYQTEHRVRMEDGSYRWHLSRGVPVRDASGMVVKWFGTATDIDDQKIAEEALRLYAERLERSNRDLQEFAFVASHDLQEPLRKIEMFGDLLLQRSAGLDERERDFLSRMRDAAHRMRAMVDGLLQLSRLSTQAQPFQPVDLQQTLAEVLDALETALRLTGAEVTVGDLPVVQADPLQMRQLFQNLLANALKFQPPGRKPVVNVGARLLPGDWVEIIVEDNGIGFDPEHSDALFQPFQRLVGRSLYPGSGMGLAICRRIVERHGGRIFAAGQPDAGARFAVILPRDHRAAAGPGQ